MNNKNEQKAKIASIHTRISPNQISQRLKTILPKLEIQSYHPGSYQKKQKRKRRPTKWAIRIICLYITQNKLALQGKIRIQR